MVFFFNRRLLKFIIVGLSGVIVNELSLYILYFLSKELIISSIIAIEISILSNFILNDRWTFKSKQKNNYNLLRRFFRYNGVTIIGLIVNVGTLYILTHFGLNYLLSNIIGIILGFISNYTGSELIVWSDHSHSSKNHKQNL